MYLNGLGSVKKALAKVQTVRTMARAKLMKQRWVIHLPKEGSANACDEQVTPEPLTRAWLAARVQCWHTGFLYLFWGLVFQGLLRAWLLTAQAGPALAETRSTFSLPRTATGAASPQESRRERRWLTPVFPVKSRPVWPGNQGMCHAWVQPH